MTPPTVGAILAAVAIRFDVPICDLVSARQGRGVVRPRQLVMWLARHCTALSLPQIGKAVGGRDHTTVLHSIQRVEGYLRSDPVLARAAVDLRTKFAWRAAA
jgi:chromosomal replication initiator protein